MNRELQVCQRFVIGSVAQWNDGPSDRLTEYSVDSLSTSITRWFELAPFYDESACDGIDFRIAAADFHLAAYDVRIRLNGSPR